MHIADKVFTLLRIILSPLILLSIFSKITYGADHTIQYPSLIEEYSWTYGCTPTASAMVLSYWDSPYRQKDSLWDYYYFVGMGRLIDYYFIDQCSGYNVPNTIVELKNALDTDYNANTCSGSGKTDPWDIDNGVAAVTNSINGYTFNSYKACGAIWPEVLGDWCWDYIKQEINLGRPFVWSTGDLSLKGHSVAAWGYTDDKYVILYDTWTPNGREDWYYKYYLGDPDNSIESTQVNTISQPNFWELDDFDLSLDDPIGGERLFGGSTYTIWWYQWGAQAEYEIDHVDIYYSLDSGRSWDGYVGTRQVYSGNKWEAYVWDVPDITSNSARIRIMAFDSDNNYLAGDGSRGNFTIIRDTAAPDGTILINGILDIGGDYTNQPSVDLALSCTDYPIDQASGCTEMRISNDNITWTEWKPYVPAEKWSLAGGDGTKTVYVQYRDASGNGSASFSDTIILDTTGPSGTISINNGALYATSRDVNLNLASSESVEMRFWDYHDPVWTPWEKYADIKPWTLNGPDTGEKLILVQFKDMAGNTSMTSDTIVLETSGPGGSISIDNGAAHTNSIYVILSLSCTDYESGCADMRFSNDSTTWTDWEPYFTSKSWTLTEGDGTKTAYVQYRNFVGQISANLFDSIVVETVAPTGSIAINNGTDHTNTGSVTLTLSCSDTESGCSEMRVSDDNENWTAWEPYATRKSWMLAGGEETSIVYAQFKDVADNVSTVSDTILFDSFLMISPIDNPTDLGNMGSYSSLAVDSNNRVHISYVYEYMEFDPLLELKYDVRYATNASGPWTISTIDSGSYQGGDTSIALDSNDSAHISYVFRSSISGEKTIKYATNAGGGWASTTVDPAGNVGESNSIAVDSNDHVHISYNEGSGAIKYATNSSGPWVISTIDSGNYQSGYTSIAVDSNDKVHISYYYAVAYGGSLKYATNASGSWAIATVDGATYSGRYSSIAIDSDDHAHISYQRYTGPNDHLKYATNASGAWVVSTVDSTGDVGAYSSIAVDSMNRVHMTYYDFSLGDLRYTTNASGSWFISTLDSELSVGQYSSIAIDSNDKLHISYKGNGDLRYATNDEDGDGLPDTWEQQIVDVDPEDGFMSVDDVLAGDDFDGDGESNWTEYENATNPTDSMSARRGDANHDGYVDLADAVQALQTMSRVNAGSNVTTYADINGDGCIGLEEITYILQKISGVRY